MTDEKALQVVEAEFIELGSIRTTGPADVIHQASQMAEMLADIVNQRQLYTSISGRKFVRVEGWTTLGAMLGVLPREVDTQPIENGYQSMVELVRVNDGAVIGRGSAICTRDERNWKARDDFAVRSMAITRATGKAYRLGFSWIMTLAGYEPTPAEEMDTTPQRTSQPRQQQSQPAPVNGSKLERPLTPEQVQQGLFKRESDKSDVHKTTPATPGQAGLLAGKFDECYAPAEDSRDKYHAALNWLWGVESAKELTIARASVTIDWLLLSEDDGGGKEAGYPLHPAAAAEAEAIYLEAMIAAGQQKLEL